MLTTVSPSDLNWTVKIFGRCDFIRVPHGMVYESEWGVQALKSSADDADLRRINFDFICANP